MSVAFGEFELDIDAFELRRGGRPVGVQPKVLDVLFYLVRNRERVVTRRRALRQGVERRFGG